MSKEELGKSVISTPKRDDEKYPGRFHIEVCPGNLARKPGIDTTRKDEIGKFKINSDLVMAIIENNDCRRADLQVHSHMLNRWPFTLRRSFEKQRFLPTINPNSILQLGFRDSKDFNRG
ncbi:unnamed protein product [Porites evermanni]|uniref:Uncharacterized protein n=1 Tax=Porites evermanni TaxID=104178 RepID=A0ABN8Q455_9CNID|nr:unnamed protein product [Porites evermanni]